MNPKHDVASRILIVDDEQHERFVLTRILARVYGDDQVVSAASGQAALNILRASSFDLLLTDVHMAKMDGVQLTKALRAFDSEIVVLWITAHGCYHYKTQAAQLDVARCLNKPLDIDAIRQAVRDALAEEDYD